WPMQTPRPDSATLGGRTATSKRGGHMRAKDVMTTAVITVQPDTTVQEIARLMLECRVSAVPVVENRNLVGIVSEGDLMRRPEAGTQRKPSWWLRMLMEPAERAAEYVKTHG